MVYEVFDRPASEEGGMFAALARRPRPAIRMALRRRTRFDLMITIQCNTAAEVLFGDASGPRKAIVGDRRMPAVV